MRLNHNHVPLRTNRHIANKFIIRVREDGIVMIRTRKDNSIIGLSDFDELYRKLDELSAPKGKLLLLFDLSNNPQMDKNSRAFIYAEEMIQNTKALAFSASDEFNSLLGKFLAQYQHRFYPIRLFSTEAQAIQWLSAYDAVEDDRIEQILNLIDQLAALNFQRKYHVSEERDAIDFIGYGLNMISEELEFALNEKSRLERENITLSKTIEEITLTGTGMNRLARIMIANKNEIITSVNTEFCDFSKHTKKEILGSEMLSASDYTKESLLKIRKTLTKGSSWRQDTKLHAKDGSEYWVDNNIIPIENDQFLIIQLDITARKTTEKKLLLSVFSTRKTEGKELSNVINKEITTTLAGLQYILKSLDDKITALRDSEMQMLIKSVRKNFEHIIGNAKRITGELSANPVASEDFVNSLKAYVDDLPVKSLNPITVNVKSESRQRLLSEDQIKILYLATTNLLAYLLAHAGEYPIELKIDLSASAKISLDLPDDKFDVKEALNDTNNDMHLLMNLVQQYAGTVQVKKTKGKPSSIIQIELPFCENKEEEEE